MTPNVPQTGCPSSRQTGPTIVSIVGESCLGGWYNGLSSPSFGGRFIILSTSPADHAPLSPLTLQCSAAPSPHNREPVSKATPSAPAPAQSSSLGDTTVTSLPHSWDQK